MRTKIEVAAAQKSFASARARCAWSTDVDFSVGDGEFVAIVGPSGCGKSTLMNIIAGFVRPDEGSVMVDGAEVTRAELAGHPDLAARLGVSVAHGAART